MTPPTIQTTAEHERIWLQPRECVDEGEGRQWCEDDVWEAPGVEYVLATRLEHLERALTEMREAAKPFVELFEKRWAEYPDAPDIAPISLGFALHAKKRIGDLQLSDFRKLRALTQSGNK